MTFRKQDYFVAEIVEFSLPGARKFRFIRTPGMKIAKRISLVISGLLKFDTQHNGDELKYIVRGSDAKWLGIDRNAVASSQLMHSIIMSYGVIGSVKQSQLISKALEVAKFNFETYKEIPDFQGYINSLIELKAEAFRQPVVAVPFVGSNIPAVAGYDVYMRLKNTSHFIATSVLVTTDIKMDGLTDYKTKEINDIAHVSLWQLIYFTIGLDVSMLFSTLSSRYYLANAGLMGDKISFDNAYGKVADLKNRINAVLSAWAGMAVNKDYEVVAMSKTLNSATIKRVPTSSIAAETYNHYCEHRQSVEAGSYVTIQKYAGYRG